MHRKIVDVRKKAYNLIFLAAYGDLVTYLHTDSICVVSVDRDLVFVLRRTAFNERCEVDLRIALKDPYGCIFNAVVIVIF